MRTLKEIIVEKLKVNSKLSANLFEVNLGYFISFEIGNINKPLTKDGFHIFKLYQEDYPDDFYEYELKTYFNYSVIKMFEFFVKHANDIVTFEEERNSDDMYNYTFYVDDLCFETKNWVQPLRSTCKQYNVNNIIIESVVNEKLKISTTKQKTKHTLFPQTREQLYSMIKKEIELNGPNCSLNHIDVSKITDMCGLFENSEFDGDISEWDVSNVTDFCDMFRHAAYTGSYGDISNWDVSQGEDFDCMFYYSFLEIDYKLNWNMSNAKKTPYMFAHTKFNGDVSDWNMSNVIDISGMFRDTNFDGDVERWDVSNVIYMHNTFLHTPIEDKNNYPSWYKK